MCVKLSLATTLDVNPCATKRPRICDYNKFLFFLFFFWVLCCLFYFYFSNKNIIYKVCVYILRYFDTDTKNLHFHILNSSHFFKMANTEIRMVVS